MRCLPTLFAWSSHFSGLMASSFKTSKCCLKHGSRSSIQRKTSYSRLVFPPRKFFKSAILTKEGSGDSINIINVHRHSLACYQQDNVIATSERRRSCFLLRRPLFPHAHEKQQGHGLQTKDITVVFNSL